MTYGTLTGDKRHLALWLCDGCGRELRMPWRLGLPRAWVTIGRVDGDYDYCRHCADTLPTDGGIAAPSPRAEGG